MKRILLPVLVVITMLASVANAAPFRASKTQPGVTKAELAAVRGALPPGNWTIKFGPLGRNYLNKKDGSSGLSGLTRTYQATKPNTPVRDFAVGAVERDAGKKWSASVELNP